MIENGEVWILTLSLHFCTAVSGFQLLRGEVCQLYKACRSSSLLLCGEVYQLYKACRSSSLQLCGEVRQCHIACQVMWLGSVQLAKVRLGDVAVLSSQLRVVDTARNFVVIVDSQLSMSVHVAAVVVVAIISCGHSRDATKQRQKQKRVLNYSSFPQTSILWSRAFKYVALRFGRLQFCDVSTIFCCLLTTIHIII